MSCACDEIAGGSMELSQVCIGNLWIFQDLTPEEITALSKDAKRQQLKKGAMLFHQGDEADEMFLIKAGRIKMDKYFEDGSRITLDIRKPGDFLGENMFSEQGTFPVSATCIEDTLTCGFTRAAFEKKILAYPNIGLQIIKALSNRINHLTGRVGSMAAATIEDRLFRVLSNVAKEHGSKNDHGLEIRFPLTHEDLGFLTGAHRVSITRAMKALKNSGRILLKDNLLILPA